jgi:competence protein ComEA
VPTDGAARVAETPSVAVVDCGHYNQGDALVTHMPKSMLLKLVLSAALSCAGLGAHAADDKKGTSPVPKAQAQSAVPDAQRMDINTASEAQLATLEGIGEMRAKAIVKGRPYDGRDDLVKKKIIPQGVYDKIKDQVIARRK